ncbi:MAG: hypothetical protein IPM27_03165 [Nitrosomonadales bacterium]|nr:hypothetical protein [Nitrosomonadales bacterium]
MRGTLFIKAAVFCVVVWSGAVSAQDGMLDPPLSSGEYNRNLEPFKLAENDSVVLVRKQPPAPEANLPAFEPSAFSGSKVHQYLGIATAVAAAATFLTHFHPCEGPNCGPQPPRSTHGQHANLGKATAALALATVASGLLTHWDDFHKEDGLSDPDNLHVLLGVTGAALMAYAINKSANSTTTPTSHAAMAELGALNMILAIKLTW